MEKKSTLVDFNRACSYWRSEHAVLQYEQNKAEKFAIEILIESPVEILERVYLP